MLIKPLAYKGPADHLTSLFSEQSLFEGLKLLIQRKLFDWQFDQGTEIVSGKFESDSKIVESEISWPLDKSGSHCNCSNQLPCIHVAALAIETKCRIDAIKQPIKEVYDNETLWHSTLLWLKKQSFDPYPNMARHRLVYLLKREENEFFVSFYKAYLTQDGKYQLKEKFNYREIQFKKLPKFISLHDQSIIFQCQKAADRVTTEDNVFPLSKIANNSCDSIFKQMLSSHRCFWKASSRPPLKIKEVHSTDEKLELVTQHHYLDLQNNQILSYIGNSNSKSISDSELRPKILISSYQIDFPWTNGLPNSMDAGLIRFVDQFNTEWTFESLKNIEKDLSQHQKQSIAKYIRQIQTVGTIKGHYEEPVAQKFDIADRALNITFSQLVVWLAGLVDCGWQVEITDSFKMNSTEVDDWYIDLGEQQDWFELELGIKVNDQSINIMPYLVKAIAKGQIDPTSKDQSDLQIQLETGEIVTLAGSRVSQILLTLMELFDRKPLTETNRVKLPLSYLPRISQLTKVEEKYLWQGSDYLKQKITQLSQAKPDELNLPKTLKATLRDYQKSGVNWLHFLKNNHLGGILADDMGLGKTLQTLTMLLIEQSNRQLKKPALIIAPTSLLFNWKNEASKFAPSLNLHLFYGSQRHESLESFSEYDVIVTSYGIVQRDIKDLKKYLFHSIILDEAQAIKNSKTKVARCCFSLNSEYRLCLTGTPLENHLGEIWSLFNFLMPGFLGSEAQFNRIFRTPIEKEFDDTRQKELSKRIAPFMLRRTKTEVARELPPKTEFERIIEMPEAQADVYEAVRLSMSNEIQKALKQSQSGKNQLLISNALLRLRQICCHPKMIKLESSHDIHESAKLEWLANTLPEMIEEGRYVLIFSSFTTMLDIVEEELQSLNIPNLKLTGKSGNRGQLVDDFQSGKYPVFLISLKAGGVGLNLTRADTVIHTDPWWNPAAEDQASDRAYRIGQDKPVFVYKLITRGTVEERILAMQKKKQQLSDKIYANSLKSIDKIRDIDWETLFQPIEE
ncbi:DEAD/DEAH box helicase [Pleionea sediminis]|uniref:DEAD/DEAH box helicase n=1 Tax=Pleionea sediminis TaxID=2569479 RepID=UPI001186EAA6|nr:DEAD/DEAH box helicase [Pleionea sediminis]